MRHVVDAGGQVQEARVLKTLDDFGRELVGDAHVGVAGRSLVVERYLLVHCGVFLMVSS